MAQLGVRVEFGRVHGLGVSRTFGDGDSKAKGPGVVPTPQVMPTRALTAVDEMVILGCDGEFRPQHTSAQPPPGSAFLSPPNRE